jgi:TetR/AcrR family transcriptional repressor of nem operon
VIGSPKTARGRATRERLVTAASELIAERGVAATSLDDVIERAGTSKSQLYHYFEDRAALLRAVVLHNTDSVLAAQMPHIESLATWTAIRAWLDSLVELQVERHARGGCPVGSLLVCALGTASQRRPALDARSGQARSQGRSR